MQIKDIIAELEQFAPLTYQESYDNSGLQVGDLEAECTAALLTLDVTEAVLSEAIAKGCNLIIAHHPLIFSGIKRLTGRHYVERILLQAIKANVAIYGMHTNLDNMFMGVNQKIAQRLGLVQTRTLAPTTGQLFRLITYVPEAAVSKVKDALFAAGMGQIGGYEECSFSTKGEGSFRPGSHTNPAIGEAGGARIALEEQKLEVMVPKHLRNKALQVLHAHHPYEEVAYELIRLENEHQYIGSGLIGELPAAMPAAAFLGVVKDRLKVSCIRYTALLDRPIKTVALCGGSGSFLLSKAVAQQADIFISADFKYHQFFDADGRLIIADIGHYESEQFTIEIFSEILKKKFPNFALLFTQVNTNPVNYYF